MAEVTNQNPTPKGPLNGILRWLRQSGSGSEGDSKRNGILSYAGEYHSLVIGFSAGYVGGPDLQSDVLWYALGRGTKDGIKSKDAHIRDVADEPAYALAALSAGKMLKRTDLALSQLPL